jgi:hypothetical protein
VLLIAAVQALHARWFPSLPARNPGLARAQFRNATEGMTQQVKCLMNDTCIQNQNGLSGRRKGRLVFVARHSSMGSSSLFFLLAYVGCGISILRLISSRFAWSAQLCLLLWTVSDNTYPSMLLSGRQGTGTLPVWRRNQDDRRPSLHPSET